MMDYDLVYALKGLFALFFFLEASAEKYPCVRRAFLMGNGCQ